MKALGVLGLALFALLVGFTAGEILVAHGVVPALVFLAVALIVVEGVAIALVRRIVP